MGGNDGAAYGILRVFHFRRVKRVPRQGKRDGVVLSEPDKKQV
jgi:hypothetical protein